LYYSQRLMELPLGMFTIAVSTVLFPRIAMLAAQDDRTGMGRAYAQGLRLILAITVPAALGLVALRVPIVRVLFEHGKFDDSSVAEIAPVIAISALSIPFFSLASLAVRGFYAQKDMGTPVYVAKVDFFLNIALTLIFMIPLGTCGLALANLISSIFQCFMLQHLAVKRGTPLARPPIGRAVAGIGIAGTGMLVFALAAWWGLQSAFGDTRITWLLHTRASDLAAIFGLIPLAVVFYLILLRAVKFEEWPELRELGLHLLRKRK
ncbi:MAG TPA: lipid II flippase MurJ, partial [Opitutales bacterium]|nr:lipid II flippase MurJ [Opitutales bacterium]